MEAVVPAAGDPALRIGRGVPRRRGTGAAGPRPLAARVGGPVCVAAGSASLQTAAALATTVFATFGAAGTGALRFAFAAPVLLLVARARVRGRTRAFWLTTALFGATLAALNFSLYEAIARVPLGTAVTLQFLGPLALALVAARRRMDLVWVAAAGGGVLLVTGGPAGGSAAGVSFALLSAAITIASLLVARRLATQSAGIDGLAFAVTAAAVITLPLSVPAALATASASDLAVVAAVGVLGIAVPYALEYVAIRLVSVRTFSILLSLDPAIAVLAGLVWLGQSLAAADLLGVALVTVASAGVMRER